VYELAQHEILEKIYDGDTSVIYRAQNSATEKFVILKFLKKNYPGNELLRSFTREYSITASFQSEQIVKAYSLEKYQNSLVMILEDCGSVTLASIISKVKKDLGWGLDIAIKLTDALIEIHQQNVIHQDLNPANILYDNDNHTIKIIDFGAAEIDHEVCIPSIKNNITISALPYISPEQTGRYNKILDYRTDLYSLGITLYQLFTGTTPFWATDPIELIHFHLATPPRPPSLIDLTIPETLSNIILKLIRKPRKPRYQTCSGLLADLHRCREEWQSCNTISKFILGENDLPDKLIFPKKLFNREHALSILHGVIQKKKESPSSVIVIRGSPGIGKTSLVYEFKNSLPRHSHFFLTGKCDLVALGRPYCALTEVLQILVSSILVKSKDSIRKWKIKIVETLQENGQILVDLIPELEIIIGKQPPQPPLSPYEAEQRLCQLCCVFIQLFATANRPVIIFLDDIHRADLATLKLIHHLTTSPVLRNVFFIFCYRDNEVNKKHLLTATLNSIQQKAEFFTTLQLPSLNRDNVVEFLSITLSYPRERVVELAEICFKKTGGNPFFLKQFIHSINRKGYLKFSPQKRRFHWNIPAITCEKSTRNITDILVQRIQMLPKRSVTVLKNAACIGKSFSLQTLASTVDRSTEKLWSQLQELFSEGLLVVDTMSADRDTSRPRIFFAHDQVQQVAYSLLTEEEKRMIHLKIGQYLQNEGNHRLHEFDIVSHLNRATTYITSPTERLDLAAANLRAGKKAKNTASYETALSFLQVGLTLLPEKSWSTHYTLTLDLHTEASEAAYLNHDYDKMEQLFRRVCSEASSLLDKTRVYRIKIRAQKSSSRLTEAVETGEEILNMLGVRLPKSPSRILTSAQFIGTRIFMSRWKTYDLLNLPEMKSTYQREAMRFLVDIGTAAYYAKPKLLPFIAMKAIQLSLKYGNSTFAGQIAYPTYGILLCGIPGGNVSAGYNYGQLALKLQERLNTKTDPATIYLVNNLIIHWKDHIRETLPPLLTAFKGCTESGEFEYAANAAYSYSYRLYYLGQNLNKIQQELDYYHGEIEKYNQPIALTRQNLYRQAVANLLETNGSPERFQGEFYNEKEMIPHHKMAGDHTTLFQLYLLKMIHCHLFGKYVEALTCSRKAQKLLQSILSSIFVPIYHFYDSLIRLALYEDAPKHIRLQHSYRIKNNQRKMKKWSAHSPQNYHHKYNLVEAEKARVKGHRIQALDLYDSAIDLARTNGYLQEEALALELTGRYYASLGKVHLARPYMRESRYCYYRWGAIAKVEQLDRQKSVTTLGVSQRLPSPDIIPKTFLSRRRGSGLDMMTVVKASRILTEETTLSELLKKIMQIFLESSGAQRGVLVFKEKERWYIKVAGSAKRTEIDLLDNIDLDSQNRASSAIINYVISTKRDLILSDATREGMFTDDQYIVKNSPLSILCVPLIHHKEIVCILYLENNLTARAFPPERQELLHLLGNQAVINIKNSRLFEKLKESVSEFRLEIKKRRKVQLQLLHSEKLSALGRLSSSIAHEFGNPLMGIRYLLSDFIERPDLSSEDRDLLHLGMEECQRMKKLLKNLGQLNRPTTGEKTRTNIQKTMDNVLFFQDKYLYSQNLKIVKNYTKNLPDTLVIEDQISQVLLNLIINAIDATKNRGGTITITTWKTETNVFLSVADTGKGIDPEYQDNIFEPFFSTKKTVDGTGLGLSTSYGIIKQHKGQLTFVSETGKGTKFTLSLPRS